MLVSKYHGIVFITDGIVILLSTPVQTAMNLYNVSAVKIKLFNIFSNIFYDSSLVPLLFMRTLTYFCSALFFWLAFLFSFMKKASVCLLYIDLQLSNDKERVKKHVFIHQ